MTLGIGWNVNIAQHLVVALLICISFGAYGQENTDDIPAAKQSLLKTAATKEFNKPLYFDQIDNGLILPPLELEYEMTPDGRALKVGSVLLSDKTFSVAFAPLGKTHSQLNQVLGSENGQMSLAFYVPESLINPTAIEMVSRTGRLLWSYNFSENDLANWNKRLDDWRKELIAKGVSANNVARSGIFSARYAFVDARSAGVPLWNQKESFRFCLSETRGRNSSRVCSPRYGMDTAPDGALSMLKVRVEPVKPRVLLHGQEAPLKQTMVVPMDSPTSFFAELLGGESYEFITLPNKLELMDIADTAKPNLLRIVGYDTRPLGRSVILNPDQYSGLTKMLGFEATIGDSRKFWAAAILREDPKVYLPGEGGGIFKQRFELSQIPRAQSRVYLDKRTPTGTYNDGIKLFGRKQPAAKVSTDQNSVRVDSDDPSEFMWRFKAEERGQINRSYLNVEMDGKTYRSYFELYKGFPRELSGRFSGVQTASGFIVMGEVAYNQWFEDIFSWSNYWVSRQRWGINAKYFKSFNELKVKDGTAPLSVLTVDLKYRFTPGLWGRDETVGLLASYQDVGFGELKAPMLGGGIFWARSMPKVFDDFLNTLIIMRYPKWVDMEFIYYGQSMNSDVTLNAPMSLNFHGKVLWSDRYFGEAGFGIKRYSFQDKVQNQKAELNTFYGTVGLGINF
ncbi:hypothetical protein AZI86_15425 [Bdellovibrio bacteriovorus]|uniref:Uncharacterized protein n=1 Tax=Bdellovibrio bacteriovorus TaxID=959 RepID=A0A150WI55_BDEBC|nr:hypothetical protein AZI86_15425 [Bdellovibrio bacteriovorus]